MATKKISELEAITSAADDDVLVIVDTSEETTNKITKANFLAGSGHTIEMSLNSSTYQLTLKLKNAEGTVLGIPQVVDLPNEDAIIGITYNNGRLLLTKQSGQTSAISISGLINGLVTTTTFNNFVSAIKAVIGINTNTYDSTQTYNTGDIVVQDEKIYKCLEDNVTGTFDSTKWEEISIKNLIDDLNENKEDTSNKTTTIDTTTPSNTEYPSESAVVTYVSGIVGDIESILETLDIGSGVSV